MLHFPSANTAAHRPSARDVAKLAALLDDDVWAFTNCRVDAPGRPVAEVDWFFYNVRHGTLMVSEWKGFPRPVRSAADTGKPWVLDDGLHVSNPVEQVARQLDAVRSVLRSSILPRHFPSFDPQHLQIAQSVYSAQVGEHTAIERIRWGKVYGSLSDLAAGIAAWTSPSPLVLPSDGDRLGLAAALCALLRTDFPAGVKAKLREPAHGGNTDVVQRISAIHRQIAALHGELADLMLVTADGNRQPARTQPVTHAPKAVSKPPQAAVKVTVLTEQQRMQAHLERSFKGVNGSKPEAAKALEKAWRTVLNDPLLHRETGISVGLFGSLGTPLVKQHHGTLQKVLGMQLRKWCLLQAKAVGMKPLDVPGKPSNIRVR